MAVGAAGVFAGMDGAQLDRALGVLGEGAEADPLYGRKIGRLKEMGLTEAEAREAAGLYYTLRIGALNPRLAEAMLEGSDVDGGEKKALLSVLQKTARSALEDDRAKYNMAASALTKAVAEILRRAGTGSETEGANAGWDAYVPARNAANVRAFDEFVAKHASDPEFKGKYAAFVHGKFQKIGESEDALVEEMRRKFGYVKMCVGEVTTSPPVMYIESPELA